MRKINVKVHPSSANLKKEDQLAWKIAEIATDKSKPSGDAIEMVINRIIDNASVAIASFSRKPVISAREMALAHPRKNGATIFGIDRKQKFHLFLIVLWRLLCVMPVELTDKLLQLVSLITSQCQLLHLGRDEQCDLFCVHVNKLL